MKTRGQHAFVSGELAQRAQQAIEILGTCELCPRRCRVDRLAAERGVCGIGFRARVASYAPHFGEEQPLVGQAGSGTIFFSGCHLHCCFCQNYGISHDPEAGVEVDARGLAAIMLELQAMGCHNINFVSPTHIVPQILAALVLGYENGLNLPLVYNSSGYESVSTLELLDGVIDIYMPDFKFWRRSSAANYCEAPDYPETTRAAVKLMFNQVGDLALDSTGIAYQGLLIRHLLMPEALEETKQILGYIADQISVNTYVNIMDQYRPCGSSGSFSELENTIGPEHYRQALAIAQSKGLKRLDQNSLAKLLKQLGISLG
ncbi:MAG: radical SAM protein [Desulfocapsaceae bacterium]